VGKINSLNPKKKKVTVDFSKPHQKYYLADGSQIPGVTTILSELSKPAIPHWAFRQGKEPMYASLSQAAKEQKVNLKKLKKTDATLWAYKAGRLRKNGYLYKKRDRAAEIGTVAHEYIRLKDEGKELDSSNIDAGVWELAMRCVASYESWMGTSKVKILGLEMQLVSETYRYGGTLDKYCIYSGKKTLWDYKTGKDIFPDYFYQLSAYANLLAEAGKKVEQAFIVNLPKTKGDSFAVKAVSVDTLLSYHFKIFLSALKIYQTKKKIKNLEEVI